MSWAPWLSALPDAELMRATDRWAIGEQGVPSLELMERAGEALAKVVAPFALEGRVVVVCGKGNNGGDGLVAARLLRAAGCEVDVLLLGDPAALEGDPLANLEQLPGEPPEPFDPGRLAGAAVLVDAILGTGSSGEPREPAAGAIAAMNGAGVPVVAADVPSGVDASTGAVAGRAIRATTTVTFHRAKPGLWIAPGKAHAGMVEVAGIEMPEGAPGAAWAGLIEPAALEAVPRRGAESSKFTSGTVVVVGGSAGLTGAPSMAAMAAQRTGAGYVTVATAASAQPIVSARLLEVMTLALPEDAGALGEASLAGALDAVARAGAVVLGPGLGRAEGAQAFARALAARVPGALVLDADGLNAFAGRIEELAARGAPTVLTPHAAELGRLLGAEPAAIEAARLHHARDAAARSGAIVVLKGDDTLVALPDGRVAISPGGAPALATAGTGDVLAGVIGALLSKGMTAEHAAAAGVLAHVHAGRLAAADHGPDTVIASDVIAALPAALDPRRLSSGAP